MRVKNHDWRRIEQAKKQAQMLKNFFISVERLLVNTNIMDCINYMITIRMKDMNGQLFLKRRFAITGCDGGKAVILSEPIMGYTALSCPGNSAEEIENQIHRDLGIVMEDINVQILND